MGVVFQFVVLLITVVAWSTEIYRTKKGAVPKIGSVTCVDALEELVGRSVEIGKTVH